MPWDVRWCNKTKRFYRDLHAAFEKDKWDLFDVILYGGQEFKEKVQIARMVVDHNLYYNNKKEWEALINQFLLEHHDDDGSNSLTDEEEEEEEASIVADPDNESFMIKSSSCGSAFVR